MRCKKEIMGLAALMVLMFHFYIPFGTSAFEVYMFRSTFIGVDMFFFVSAYSLASRNSKGDFKAGSFILNRLSYIYMPFVLLSAIAAIYKKWGFTRFIRTIVGIEFYERGGGSFLWYFIGIMLIYLLVPFMLMLKRKTMLWGFPILIASWLLISSILQFGFNYTKAFILINRLPIFFIGLYYDELILNNLSRLKKVYVGLIELILFVAGTFLVYKYATTYRLLKPFADSYYVIAIPLILATIMIVNSVVQLLDGKYKSIILKFIGGITLELYGLQMVFGYDLEMKLLKVVPKEHMQLAFLGTLVGLVIMAFVFNQLLGLVHKLEKKLTLRRKLT